MDFVLWKPSDDALPGWDSPWGRGRPGWHIECSAMAHELLGETFDIHGGGNDLTFPHHENEIAQSRCMGHGFAQVWMHNEMLQVEGKKMSKSLGNFFTVRDLLEDGIGGMTIRLAMLSTHYRKPMDWTETRRREADKALMSWRSLLEGVMPSKPDAEVLLSVGDDLNTPLAIARLHALTKSNDLPVLAASLDFLGLNPFATGRVQSVDLTDYGIKLHKVRTLAMDTKDFSELDRLKEMLTNAGAKVQMSKTEVEVTPTPDFDPAKLEALK